MTGLETADLTRVFPETSENNRSARHHGLLIEPQSMIQELIANMLWCAAKASPKRRENCKRGIRSAGLRMLCGGQAGYSRFPGRQRVLQTRVGKGNQILRAGIALLVSRAA